MKGEFVMPQKKTSNKKTIDEKKSNIPKISVSIDRMVDYSNNRIKAIASANIGDAFAVHGIKVIDSQKGLFVQMPQVAYEKDGKMQYNNQFHPITADARTELNDKVLAAYEEQLNMDENESNEIEQDDEEVSDIEQSM
jgi:stage V sporulation protein G